MALSVSEQRKMVRELPKTKQKQLAMILQGKQGGKGIFSLGLKLLAKAIGPTVAGEVIKRAGNKILGRGMRPAGRGLTLAGNGLTLAGNGARKKKKVVKRKKPKAKAKAKKKK